MSTQPILMLALLGWATLPSLRPAQTGLEEFIERAVGRFGGQVAEGGREAMTKRLGLVERTMWRRMPRRVVAQAGPKGLCALEAAGSGCCSARRRFSSPGRPCRLACRSSRANSLDHPSW